MADLVYSTGAPPFPFGTTGFDDPFTYPLFSGLDPLNLAQHEGKALLLVASPFNPDEVVSLGAPPFPIGESDLNGPFSFFSSGSSPLLYLAHSHGLTTLPEDSPPHKSIQGSFSKQPSIVASVFRGADPLDTSSSSFGSITLDDPDGKLDFILGYSWDGADIEVRRGLPDDLISSYNTVARLTGAGVVGDANSKEIRLRDVSWKLSQVQLHGQVFAGTGDLEGESTLTGKVKPYAVGYNFNVPVVLLDTQNLIYMISYTSISSVFELRHAGRAWDFEGNYLTLQELIEAPVSESSYLTCLKLGLVKLGTTPTSDVTCDVLGDADVISGQAGPTTRAQIVRRIATRLGPLRLDESNQIDFTALSYLDQRQPYPVGFYWGESATKAQAIDRVLRGCLGWWVMTVAGVLLMGHVEDPDYGSPTLVLSYPTEDEVSPSRLGEMRLLDQLPPRRATYVSWRRNNFLQQASSLATALTPLEVQLYAQEARYASVKNQWVLNNYPSSAEVYVEDSGFWLEADAMVEAQRQGDLLSKPRNRYAVSCAIDPLVNVLGQRGRIDNYNRLLFGAQKRLFCCGIDGSADTSVDLHFWG